LNNVIVESTFEWELIDPCGPPLSIEIESLEIAEYTINNAQQFVTFPNIIIEP
jgi:hypothetical protein